MSMEEDLESIAYKSRLHKAVDDMPVNARAVLLWENRCKVPCNEGCGASEEEACKGTAELYTSANCKWRDIVYMSELLRNT